MRVVYLETSALLRVVLQEPQGHEVEDRLRVSDYVLASRLLQVEARRALIRVQLDHPEVEKVMPDLQRELDVLWPKVSFFEITRDICDLAGRIAPRSRLRTLDAIHLATFRRVRRIHGDVEMLTYDDRLLREL